jgi:hypothetical protein
MWSLGTAVLLLIVVCVSVIGFALRRLVAEIEPTRRSCDRLHAEVSEAVALVARDAGRAAAGRQVLARRGGASAHR